MLKKLLIALYFFGLVSCGGEDDNNSKQSEVKVSRVCMNIAEENADLKGQVCAGKYLESCGVIGGRWYSSLQFCKGGCVPGGTYHAPTCANGAIGSDSGGCLASDGLVPMVP